jgi:hypothetical protein
MINTSPFKKPDQPHNSWELFKWIWFEYRLLEKYGKTITKTETLTLILKTYFLYVVPLALLLYVIGITIVIEIDLPTWIHTEHEEKLITLRASNASFAEKFELLFFYSHLELMRWLVAGFAFGFAFGLLVRDFAFGLAGGLAVSLAGGLEGGLIIDLAEGFVFGLAAGFVFGLAEGLAFGLVISLIFGLGHGLVLGLEHGLIVGLTTIIPYYIGYFRFPFYPFYFIKSLFVCQLKNNVYFQDDAIFLPIWGVKGKLTQQAQQDPKTAQQFIDFLLEYRPLQTKLAMHLTHAATAGNWNRKLLDADKLNSPAIIQQTAELIPSDKWLRALATLKEQLIHAQNQSNIHQAQQGYQLFFAQLTEFRELTLREPYQWHHYYLNTLDDWITAAQHKCSDTQLIAETKESQAKNVYLAGTPLDPQNHSNVFMQRVDLKEELTNRVFTAREMPLFLIQGQRRVGKTSLLNFLPKLFDGSRFKIIYIDCQDPNIGDTLEWMQTIRNKINTTLELPIENWQPPTQWLKAWREFIAYLTTVIQKEKRKIILAIDEYDYFHDQYLQEDAKQGERLLGAMRSFSQHQNQVIFLFTGAYSFAELKNPNWIKYFPHSVPIKLDYLSKENTIRLITEPVPLEYPVELTEKMYELTQGHPALTQLLCQNLVNLANIQAKKQINANDLQQAIAKMLEDGLPVIDNFWGEFCESPECKQTITQIIHHQPITCTESLNRLAKHGYIIKVNEKWQMRVPLFAMGLEYSI